MSIIITYETLFDILRKEKSREDLQVLPETFYDDVQEYLKKKSTATGGPDAAAQRASIEYANIKKIMKELYDRRERKLLLIALNKARTESAIIDPSTLLPQEKNLFDTLVAELRKNKQEILHALMNGAKGITQPLTKAAPKPVAHDPEPNTEPEPKAKSPEVKNPEESASQSGTRVKFLGSVPKFLGKDMTVFGPYETGAEAELPTEIAHVLVKKGRAEKL